MEGWSITYRFVTLRQRVFLHNGSIQSFIQIAVLAVGPLDLFSLRLMMLSVGVGLSSFAGQIVTIESRQRGELSVSLRGYEHWVIHSALLMGVVNMRAAEIAGGHA